MGEGVIRQVTLSDVEALVDIYIACFPERVSEIFGGSHRRVFIRDYLLFYLAWDPASNWVYVRDDIIVGFIIVPCHYSPWRAMLSRGQLFKWIGHFFMGKYGFPIYVVKKFFSGGFAFSSDPAIKRLQGRPYIHTIGVRAIGERERSRGLLGVGRQLMRWAIADQRQKGIHFWWGIVQPSGRRFLPIWKRIGFKIRPLSNGDFLGWMDDFDDDLRPCERQ
jgi:GNAT superfamily N-acetyltransferase